MQNELNRWKIAILTFLIVAMLPQAYSYIDLASPADGSFLNNGNVTFDYYPSMQGDIDECSLEINGNVVIVNSQIQNSAFNSFQFGNMPDDNYIWQVFCTGQNGTDASNEKSFTLDTTDPMVNFIYPVNDSDSVSSIDVKFAVNDNSDEKLDCSIEIDGQEEHSLQVNKNTEITQTISPESGNHIVEVMCTDKTGNTGSGGTVQFTMTTPIVFELDLNKQTYNIGEPINLYINAPQSTNLSLEICPDGQGFVECYSSIEINSQTYPRNEILPTTNKSGTYFIDGYFKHPSKTETKRITYTVNNNLGADIEGDTNLKKGDATTLRAVGFGGKGTLSYEWTIHNGSKKTSDVITIKYDDPGKYTEIIKVTDQAGNQATETIEVNVVEAYEVSIMVRDSQTDEILEGVAVELDGVQDYTGGDGRSYFTAKKGSLDLVGFLSGYEIYNSKVNINSDSEMNIRLIPASNDTPKVQLLGPDPDREGAPEDISFSFSISNSEQSLCRLMMKDSDAESFSEMGSVQIKKGDEKSINPGLEEGTYLWKINCESGSTSYESSARTISISSGSTEAQTLSASSTNSDSNFNQNAMLESLSGVIQSYSGMGSKEREFLENLGIQDDAKDTLKLVQRSARDIHDLRYRTSLTDEEKENLREEIIQNTTSKYRSTIKSITVKETRSFVNYPVIEELIPIAEVYANKEELDIEPEELAEILDSLQNHIVVSTKAYIAEIERIDGRRETWTAITKKIKYDEAAKGSYLLEYIPKNIADTADEIIVLGNYEVIEEDPVLRFELDKEIRYYVRRKANIEEAKNVQTVLARDGLGKGLSKTTGSVTFFPKVDMKSKGFLTSLVILLLLIYAFYESNLWKKMAAIISSKADDKHIHYIRVLVNDALDNLEADNYDKSSLIYREIKLTYENLPGRIKKEVHPDIVNLVNRMDIYYSRDVSKQIEKAIEEGDMNRAHLLYSNLQGTYKKLDPDYKKEIYEKIVDIAGRLNS